MLAKIAALAAREAHRRIVGPVLAEYRKLDTPPACERPHADGRAYDVASTTAATIERSSAWDHDKRPPEVGAQFGFGRQ